MERNEKEAGPMPPPAEASGYFDGAAVNQAPVNRRFSTTILDDALLRPPVMNRLTARCQRRDELGRQCTLPADHTRHEFPADNELVIRELLAMGNRLEQLGRDLARLTKAVIG